MHAKCLPSGQHGAPRPCGPCRRQAHVARHIRTLRPLRTAAPDGVALTQPPAAPGNLSSLKEPVKEWIRPLDRTFTSPSIRDSGTLRPGAEWYPAWMVYRRREDNYVFWRDKFMRCSLDIPGIEKRWTLWSSLWYLVMQLKYFGIPPALRYIWFLAWRQAQQKVYEAHKALVLWQSKLDAYLASRAAGGAPGPAPGFSRAMALRRLHWKNGIVGELLYYINIMKTGRVHMLPPTKRPFQRPTFFFLF